MLRRRRSEGSNKAKSVLAVFWIALAAVSGVYLFTLFTNPTALGSQTAGIGASFGDATSALSAASGSPLTADQLSDMLAARDKELAEIKQTLHQLSQQVAELSGHKPAETADATPGAASEAQAPAEPEAAQASVAPAPKKPEDVAAAPAITPPPPPQKPEPVVKPAEAKPAEKPAPAPTTVAAAEPKPAETKPEAKPAAAPTPPPVATPDSAADDSDSKNSIPPPVTVSAPEVPPAGEPAASSNVPSPASPQASSPATQEAATSPSPSASETAALDPVALPPAANDGSTRYGIEIGTVAKQDALRPLWRTFLTNHAALVAGLQPRRVLAPDKKWRLIAGPFGSAAEANQACALFKKAAQPCEATVYAGDSL